MESKSVALHVALDQTSMALTMRNRGALMDASEQLPRGRTNISVLSFGTYSFRIACSRLSSHWWLRLGCGIGLMLRRTTNTPKWNFRTVFFALVKCHILWSLQMNRVRIFSSKKTDLSIK